ncbi:MAG: peptidoglycan recognition protein family protein, partial [Actinomycetota bacterium]
YNTVGFVWEQDQCLRPEAKREASVRAQVRWGGGGRAVTEAHPEHASDPGSGEGAGLVGTDPVWTGDARCLTLRLDIPAGTILRGLRAVFINTSGTADPLPGSGASALAAGWRAVGGAVGASPAEALTPEPGIISRAGWGADESLRNCDPEYADRVKMAFVHHTAGKNTYSRLAADDVVRGIYAYHTQALGWCDIGYNFLVDRFGRIYEGRIGGMTEPVIGAHAMGFNTGSAGVSIMGNFVSHAVPGAALDALTRLLAWRLDVAHVKPSASTKMVSGGGGNTRFPAGQGVKLKTVSGHRDTGFTACPGARLYKALASVRTAALNFGLPKIWQTKQRPGQFEAGLATVRWTATISEGLPWLIE